MPKLKSLRGAIGAYGRVAAGGIVEVDETAAKKMLATKRFVTASDKDIEAAQKAQKTALKVEVEGATSGFLPMPDKPHANDRLKQLIDSGTLTVDEARKFVNLQIELAPDELRQAIQREFADAVETISARRNDLTDVARDLDEREAALDRREAELESRTAALNSRDLAAASSMAPTADAADLQSASDAHTGGASQSAPPANGATDGDQAKAKPETAPAKKVSK